MAVGEAVVNVMKYAYPPGQHGDVTIEPWASRVDLSMLYPPADAQALMAQIHTGDDGFDRILAQLKTETKPVVKEEKKQKKTRFKFLKDVRAEMKRVTWPTRQDVIRWSGVVVGALLFFGIYVAILDNLIITPGLVALTGLGA